MFTPSAEPILGAARFQAWSVHNEGEDVGVKPTDSPNFLRNSPSKRQFGPRVVMARLVGVGVLNKYIHLARVTVFGSKGCMRVEGKRFEPLIYRVE